MQMNLSMFAFFPLERCPINLAGAICPLLTITVCFCDLWGGAEQFTTRTTLINFNNNTNVVQRSVPRPKRLNGNICHMSSHNNEQQLIQQQQQKQQSLPKQQQQHLQQQKQLSQQQPQRPLFNPAQSEFYRAHQIYASSNRYAAPLPPAPPPPPPPPPLLSQQYQLTSRSHAPKKEMGIIVHHIDKHANTINKTNKATGLELEMETEENERLMLEKPTTQSQRGTCFPKSYTEYYEYQQQQHERAATNPFLAIDNYKQFNTLTAGKASNDLHRSHISNTIKKTSKRKSALSDNRLDEKRFYSLKFSSGKTKSIFQTSNESKSEFQSLAYNESNKQRTASTMTATNEQLGIPLLTTSGKCNRHHFVADSHSIADGNQKESNSTLRFYDLSNYENVQDKKGADEGVTGFSFGSGTTTATVLLHPLPRPNYSNYQAKDLVSNENCIGNGVWPAIPKRKHHTHCQPFSHMPKEDLNLIEPENLSIYRSDSGISNSSYECPISGNSVRSITNGNSSSSTSRLTRFSKPVKGQRVHKSNSLTTGSDAFNLNAAHYMNLNNPISAMTNLERPTSPNALSALTSAYESAASSQNEETGASLNYSNGMSYNCGANIDIKNKKPTTIGRYDRRKEMLVAASDLANQNDHDTFQLSGHGVVHPHHTHSSSSLSVASSSTGLVGTCPPTWSKHRAMQQQHRLTTAYHAEVSSRTHSIYFAHFTVELRLNCFEM